MSTASNDQFIKPPFEFGQTVFVVSADAHHPSRVPCPVCFGELAVTVILGNREEVRVLCENCAGGCQPPSGEVTRYVAHSNILTLPVCGFEFRDGEWTIRFADHLSHRMSERLIFANEADAEQRRIELHAEAEDRAQKNFESQFRNARGKLSWTVGYHRKQIVDLRRSLAWHEAKLLAKAVVRRVEYAKAEGK